MKLIAFIVGLFFVVGCNGPPSLKKKFETWWSGLSKEQQTKYLTPSELTVEPWKYRVTFNEELRKDFPDLAEFADWANTLTPEQIEGFEQYWFTEKIKKKGQTDIANEIMNSDVVRVDIKKNGVIVRKLADHGGQ